MSMLRPWPTVSGFTVVHNAKRLEYPLEAALESLLPYCDEIIINHALSDDGTDDLLRHFKEKHGKRVRILETTWDAENTRGGNLIRDKTNEALKECQGDLCFYLQADEVLHEEDLPALQSQLHKLASHPTALGLAFDYLHFYGDCHHHVVSRNWYRREVRVIKNHKGIASFRDAQGFRQADDSKVPALLAGARVFHYGHVRTNEMMLQKRKHMAPLWGEALNAVPYELYRPLGLRRFHGSHPQVLKSWRGFGQTHFTPDHFSRRWNFQEAKNWLALIVERWLPWRMGEFTNYDRIKA